MPNTCPENNITDICTWKVRIKEAKMGNSECFVELDTH